MLLITEIEVTQKKLNKQKADLAALKKEKEHEVAEKLIEAMKKTNKDVSDIEESIKFATRLQDEIEKHGKSMNDVLEYVRCKN